jgi:hypothetical protein
VIALEQHLSAAACAHDLVAKFLEPHSLPISAYQQTNRERQQQKLRYPLHLPAPAVVNPLGSMAGTPTVTCTGDLIC